MGRTTVYNNITSPEKINQVADENKYLQGEFLEYLKSIDRAATTIKQYEADLNVFFVWNLENNANKDFIKISKREFAKFQNYAINEWQWSPKRTRRVKSVLSSLSNFIENIMDEEEGYEGYRSVVKKIESPVNEAVREKTVLSEETVEEFLNRLVDEKRYQQACLFALAAMSGARKQELLRFKVDFFTEENVYIPGALYKTPKIKTKGRGKNGKVIPKYVLYDFKKYYDLWMEERKELGIDSEWLFVSKDKEGIWQQMSVSTVDSWADRFSKDLGVDFYFHCLRHFMCSRMKKLNIPDHIIKEFFMWESVEMISIYSDIDASEDFDKYFTSNGMVEGTSGNLSDL